MKYFFDVIIGMLLGVALTISFLDHDTIIQYQWIGIAIGIGLAFTIGKWNKDKIDELEKEIEELKKNGNREEIA